MKKNIATGKITWQQLCVLAQNKMANPIGEVKFKKDLLYVWTTSIGVAQLASRRVVGGVVRDFIPNEMQPGDGSGYKGFEGCREVIFESATSGAILRAVQRRGEWILVFVGRNPARPYQYENLLESSYYEFFKEVVDGDTIIVRQKGELPLN